MLYQWCSGSAVKATELSAGKLIAQVRDLSTAQQGELPLSAPALARLADQKPENGYHFGGKVTAFLEPWHTVMLATGPQKCLWMTPSTKK